MKTSKRFPMMVRWWLWLAGWRSGQDRFPGVSKLPELELFPAAEKIIREFHGVLVGGFRCSVVEINPDTFCSMVDEVRELELQLKRRLYPIGDRGLSILLVAENGEIYGWFADEVTLIARDFDEALVRMLLGRPDEGGAAS
jgi:hypothetical protein